MKICSEKSVTQKESASATQKESARIPMQKLQLFKKSAAPKNPSGQKLPKSAAKSAGRGFWDGGNIHGKICGSIRSEIRGKVRRQNPWQNPIPSHAIDIVNQITKANTNEI